MSVADASHLKRTQKLKKKLFLFCSSEESSLFLYALKKYLILLDSSLSAEVIFSLPSFPLKQGFFIISFFNSVKDLSSLPEHILPFLPWIIILEKPPFKEDEQMPALHYFSKPLYVQDIALWIHGQVFPSFHDKTSSDVRISIGSFLFDPVVRCLINKETLSSVSLTEKEALLLTYLYKNQKKIISKEDILEEIWGYKKGNNILTRTLESHIYSLRKKLEEDPAMPKMLFTEKGGYCLHLA